MLGDQPLRRRLCFFGQFPEKPRVCLAELRFQLRLAPALTGAKLSTVAPGRSPADTLGFEQYDIIAALGEVQRAGQASEPTTDDTGITGNRLLQRRVIGQIAGGRRVVGIYMSRAVHR